MIKLTVVVALAMIAVGCSSSEDAVTPSTLEGPITVGSISPPLDPRGVSLEPVGYVEEEWFASGDASEYTAASDFTPDGMWAVLPTRRSAPYRTRMVVRRPADPAAFNGVVALEWLNVSALELSPDWSYVSDAMTDEGVIWIGLSAQALGINGGRSILDTGSPIQDDANRGIRATNPERYGSLDHPGDSFSYDIYGQVAAALRSPEGAAVLGGVPLERILAVGESQSAAWLTTYVNAFQPTTQMFDPAPGTPSICALLGTTTPFDDATLHSLYSSAEEYLETVEASLDEAIAAGYIRASDREGYLDEVRRNGLPG